MRTECVHQPRLYPILDAAALERAGLPLAAAAQALRDAGLRWVQYRDKSASDAQVLDRLRLLRTVFPKGEAILLLNDRVALCVEADADGAHIGQEDMAPAAARRLLGAGRLLGVSTHNPAQLSAAIETCAADYLAIGPVYATGSKQNPDPVIGLEGVAAARAQTQLPLVAIGGISRERGRAVLEAGANSVAVISAVMAATTAAMTETVRDFLAYLR